MAQQNIMLNRVEEQLSSMSDVAKADNIELQQNYGECSKKHRGLNRTVGQLTR